MLDWLSSKIAMTVAAVIILASMIGFFAIQNENFKIIETQNAANRVASVINDVGGIAGNTHVNVTFDPKNTAAHHILPRTIANEDYDIEFTPTLVFVKRGGVTVSSKLTHKVHIWNPGDMVKGTRAQLDLADAQFLSFALHAGTDFTIVRRNLVPAGYQTFVYDPATAELQAVANANAVGIETFTTYAFDGVSEDWNETVQMSVPTGVDSMQVFPTMFMLEKDGLRVVHFMGVRHLWDPEQEILGEGHWRVDFSDLGDIDNATASLILQAGDDYWIERKELEFTDRPLTNPPKEPPEYEHVLEYFLYV